MKKVIFALLLTGVAVLGFAQTAVMKEVTGTVELKPSGTVDFIPAGVGVEVAQNTIISTGFKSIALVQAGSAVITVRPLTRLTLTEIQASQGTENLNLSLQAGRVRVDLNPPAGSKASLGVSSPTATASVRGTSFDFDTRNLKVHSGTVAFIGKWGYQVSVQEGRTSVVTASGTVAAPQSTSTGGGGSVSQQGAGTVAQGYDNTAGTTGGTGVIGSGSKEGQKSPPPSTTNPPISSGGGSGVGGGGVGTGGGGSGGSGGGNTGGGIKIPISY